MSRLADNIELIVESSKDDLPEYIVAVYTNKYKDYLVNKTTFDFMEYFKESTSLEAVIKKYIHLTKAKGNQVELVKNQLTSFYTDIVRKGWIVNDLDEIAELFHDTYYEKGDAIDGYKILKVLANNQLTDVYLVKKPDSRKRFVLKYLNYKKFKNKDRYTRYRGYFLKEFNFLQKFNSNSINKGILFNNQANNCYMILQFINGKSISRYINNDNPLAKEKMAIATKVIKAFSQIHQHAIYHGDIHLSNVLVTPNKQVKIIDFGYANHVDEEIGERKTRNGGVHGFIPPERALRSISRKFNAVAQFQSEVYQIGLLLYYIFVKELPFQAETWKTMVDEKKNFNVNKYEPFINRRIPKQVKMIIAKCLEGNPDLRYENAKRLLIDWKKALK